MSGLEKPDETIERLFPCRNAAVGLSTEEIDIIDGEPETEEQEKIRNDTIHEIIVDRFYKRGVSVIALANRFGLSSVEASLRDEWRAARELCHRCGRDGATGDARECVWCGPKLEEHHYTPASVWQAELDDTPTAAEMSRDLRGE